MSVPDAKALSSHMYFFFKKKSISIPISEAVGSHKFSSDHLVVVLLGCVQPHCVALPMITNAPRHASPIRKAEVGSRVLLEK